MDTFNEYDCYPKPKEVDDWVESIWDEGNKIKCRTEILNDNGFLNRLGVYHLRNEITYVKFDPEFEDVFYGFWQPAMSTPAPLLFHSPGYNADISMHPDLVAHGYNVLHVSPLGYTTPEGCDETKKRNGVWPVFSETIESNARKGYRQWIINCMLAIKWAMNQPEVIKNRISFFGTSQGGAGSLLLGSIYMGKGVRCVAADVPALTNVPLAKKVREKPFPFDIYDYDIDKDGWRAMGMVDTISHVHRYKFPVLLTAGGKDNVCPSEAVKSLFEMLPDSCSYSYFRNLEHRYSREFIYLVTSWIKMYA